MKLYPSCQGMMSFWLLLLLTLCCTSQAAISPVLVPNESFDFGVTPYVSVYEDSSGELTIDDMLSPEQQLRFTPSHSDKLKFGVTRSTYWLRISISNPYIEPRKAVLSLSNPDLGQVSLYDISNINKPQIYNSKTRNRIGGYLQAYPFLLTVPADTTDSYLIRVRSNASINTELRLASLDFYLFSEQWDYIIQGLMLGWVLATLLFFLYLFYQQKIRFAALAAIYCLCVLIYLPAWTGLLGMVADISSEQMSRTGFLFVVLSVVAHIGISYQLGWPNRQVRQLLMATGVIYLLLNSYLLASVDTGLQILIASGLAVYSLLISVLLLLGRSRQRTAQRRMAYGGVLFTLTLLLTLLTIQNLLSLEFLHDWAILILPATIITSLVAAAVSISSQRIKPQTSLEQELTVTPQMLSHITHELRSPINGVIGMGELLNDTPLSQNQREFLDTITQAGYDMLHVVNQVSDLGKVRGSQLELDMQPVAVRTLINDTLRHFQQEAVRKQIELVNDVDEAVPQRMLADKDHLKSMLHTLINHALAYTEHGELALTCKLYQTPSTSGLTLQLRLTGHLARHEELRQALATLQYQQPLIPRDYSKLWYMLVLRQVMKRMKASLELESFTIHGASMSLYMPLQADDSIQDEYYDDSLIGERILIVEDNASVRSVLEKQVTRWGMRPESTYSGKEALAMMRTQCRINEPYTFVIIDHDMPLMNGLQLSERLLSDSEISHKPARLMLTGMNISYVRDESLDAGIQMLLSKPADPEQLRQALLSLREPVRVSQH